MICEMIGLPESDWHRMFELSNTLVGFDDPELQATPEDGANAAAEIYGYCDADRRRPPGQPPGRPDDRAGRRPRSTATASTTSS